MNKQQKIERDEAIKALLAPESEGGVGLQPGDTVYTVLRHRSGSGMMRVIDLFVIRKDRWSGQMRPWFIGHLAAQAMGDLYDRDREGIKVSGCGMDMGFHVVYSLGSVLFPEGFGDEGEIEGKSTQKKRRPKTKAEAARMIKAGYTFHGRNGDGAGWDNDGGYALKHEWI